MLYHYLVPFMKFDFNHADDLVITDTPYAALVYKPGASRFNVNTRPAYGIAIKTKGKTTYKYNGKTYISDPTHVVILKKGASYHFVVDEFGPCYVINFEILEGDIDFESIEVTDLDKYAQLCEEMASLFSHGEIGCKVKLKAKMYELFSLLIDEKGAHQIGTGSKIDIAIEYIQTHVDTRITNAELAEMCCISETYLRKLFLQITGDSPQQYIVNRRIKMAKSWLLTTDATIGEIALKLGFPDIYSFSKCFKLHVGYAPLQYRKQNAFIN